MKNRWGPPPQKNKNNKLYIVYPQDLPLSHLKRTIQDWYSRPTFKHWKPTDYKSHKLCSLLISHFCLKEVGPRKQFFFKEVLPSLNTPISTRKTLSQKCRMLGYSFAKAVSKPLFTPASRQNRNNSSRCLKVVSRNSKESWRRSTYSSVKRLFVVLIEALLSADHPGIQYVQWRHSLDFDKFRWRASERSENSLQISLL